MVLTQLEAMISRLESMKTSHGIQTIELWSGDTNTLLTQTKRLPALFLLYSSSRFKPNSIASTVTEVLSVRSYKVLVVDHQFDPKARSNNVKKSCTILQGVMELLANYEPTPSSPLWPIEERLLLAEKGTFVYAITFSSEESYRATV